jgi:hypothetical protein
MHEGADARRAMGMYMLDTAFNKGLPKNRIKARTKSQMKAWSYVGRFIWGFATIEYLVDQLFLKLIGCGLDTTKPGGFGLAAGLLLTYNLDLRKKIELIDAILKSRGVDEESDESSLSCDFINKLGDFGFSKPGTSGKDNTITYAEFDSYDAVASELSEKLEELLESATPTP